MALLYADEDFHFGVVERLRQRGHDVLTVQDLVGLELEQFREPAHAPADHFQAVLGHDGVRVAPRRDLDDVGDDVRQDQALVHLTAAGEPVQEPAALVAVVLAVVDAHDRP